MNTEAYIIIIKCIRFSIKTCTTKWYVLQMYTRQALQYDINGSCLTVLDKSFRETRNTNPRCFDTTAFDRKIIGTCMLLYYVYFYINNTFPVRVCSFGPRRPTILRSLGPSGGTRNPLISESRIPSPTFGDSHQSGAQHRDLGGMSNTHDQMTHTNEKSINRIKVLY